MNLIMIVAAAVLLALSFVALAFGVATAGAPEGSSRVLMIEAFACAAVLFLASIGLDIWALVRILS